MTRDRSFENLKAFSPSDSRVLIAAPEIVYRCELISQRSFLRLRIVLLHIDIRKAIYYLVIYGTSESAETEETKIVAYTQLRGGSFDTDHESKL